jgi:hypothetical protein
MARYLARQSAAHLAGLAAAPSGEVEAYEAVPVQAVDPRQAWDEAVSALGHFGPAGKLPKPPADWSALVAAQEPVAALPFAVGHFPQLVRDLLPLLRVGSLTTLTDLPGRQVEGLMLEPVVRSAVKKETPQAIILALGTLRLARQFDGADALGRKYESQIPSEWRAAWDNEIAALDWQRGRRVEAAKRWESLPESVPVLFNRGMAALFSDCPADARGWLKKAVDGLSESSAWHHLGRLYLALAETRA